MLSAESGRWQQMRLKIWTRRHNRLNYSFSQHAVTDVNISTLTQYKECPNDEWNSLPSQTSDQMVSAATPSRWSDDYPSLPPFVASGRAP
jgi:hypothetical protein